MSVRTAYFHVGMPKTGTTAIQEAFAASREELQSNGLIYPGTAVDHADLLPLFHQGASRHFYFGTRGIDEAAATAIANARFEEIKADAARLEGDLILSTEYFHNLAPANAAKLGETFSELGFRLKAIIYIRHPVNAAVSHANQDIKAGFRTLSECIKSPRYHSNQNTLDSYRQALGADRLIIRDYEAVKDHDCVDDILKACGYPGDLQKIIKRRSNESLSMGGAILADAYVRHKALNPDFPARRTYMFKVGGPKFSLPDETLEMVRQRSEHEVAWIKQTFGIELVEAKGNTTFSDKLSEQAVLDLVQYIASLRQPAR